MTKNLRDTKNERIQLIGSVEPRMVLFESPRIEEGRGIRCVYVQIEIFLFTKANHRGFMDQWDGF